jgi:hypothetical protein
VHAKQTGKKINKKPGNRKKEEPNLGGEFI